MTVVTRAIPGNAINNFGPRGTVHGSALLASNLIETELERYGLTGDRAFATGQLDISFADGPRPRGTLMCYKNSLRAASAERVCQEAISELNSYLEFEVGWDGYDGVPFDESDVARAIEIVSISLGAMRRSERVLDRIVPGPASDGSLDLELVFENGSLIFTIQPHDSHRLHVYFSKGETEEELDSRFTPAGVETWVARLLGSKASGSYLAAAE